MTFRSSRSAAGSRLGMVAASFVCLPALVGCVDGDYNKFRIYQEPLVEAVGSLQPGVTTLEAALAQLGAPLFVIEVGLGMSLAWGWQNTTDWNIEVSVPVGEASGNFKYTDTNAQIQGLVLFFDETWTLTSVQEGYLADLVPKRQRPRDVDDDLQGPTAP